MNEFTKAYLEVIKEEAEGRLIEKDFEKELDKAIEEKELVSFKYTKQNGSSYVMTILPTKKIVVKKKTAIRGYLNGIRKPSKERLLYISSMG